MKMLVSLIAVCLMVAVEGSFSTHNHMEYYPPGCPMHGRHSETHVMHRDNYYNGPFSPSYNGFYNDGSPFYGSYNMAPYTDSSPTWDLTTRLSVLVLDV